MDYRYELTNVFYITVYKIRDKVTKEIVQRGLLPSSLGPLTASSYCFIHLKDAARESLERYNVND